jgi:hypothetical protein
VPSELKLVRRDDIAEGTLEDDSDASWYGRGALVLTGRRSPSVDPATPTAEYNEGLVRFCEDWL